MKALTGENRIHQKAFRCLVSSATRNGQQLAAVTLNDGDDWNDHARMLDFGFENFPLVEIAQKSSQWLTWMLLRGVDLLIRLQRARSRA